MASSREAKSPQPSNGADRPNLEGGKEDSPLPPKGDEKPDTIGLPSEAVEVKRPTIEKEDGELPNEELPNEELSNEELSNEELPNEAVSPSPALRARDSTDEKRQSPTVENQKNRKRGRSDEPKDGERRLRKHKSDSPPQSSDKTSQESGAGSDLWDVLKVPRQVDRKRRGSTASRGSRHSSISSKSSDLNSLEAELLGRSVKQKQPEPSPTSRRQDRKAPLKAKRRQQNTNSAYRLDSIGLLFRILEYS